GQLAALTNGGDGDPMRPGGVAAMNWNGRVLPVRVAGKCGADVADIVDGMRWAAGLPVAGVPPNPNPARIINISFGGSAACGNLYQQAIDELRALPNGGAVVVAAAGNGWSSTISRPASCNGVVGVGALNRDGFKSNYSNFGPKVVVSTVGGDDNDGTWGPYLADSGIVTIGNASATSPGLPTYYGEFGTSFSTPIVAGAVSLMLSVNPALTVEQVIQGLRASARPHVTSSVPGVGSCSDANPGRCLCTSATCGAGILDVKRALDFAAAPTSYAPPMLSAPDVDSPELRSAVALGQDRPANPLPPPQASGGGGGGASSAPWIVALLLATCALGAAQRLSSRKARTRCRRAG
ncbi:MAG TPA: S8 family serine peptidase, partial [Burkholderiaceae bacterium]|nr:S8 family serine peptidase [Burkholderiaceae bacterium]